MPKVPVKIKKEDALESISEELKVNLRVRPVKSVLTKKETQNAAKPGLKLKRPGLLRGVIFVLIVVISVYLGNWLFSLSQKSPSVRLIPKENIALAIIDKDSVFKWPFEQELKPAIEKYLGQTNLEFQKDIQPLLKNQLALALFPAEEKQASPFIVVLQKNTSLAQFNQILSRLEEEFKKDFNLSSESYRQANITNLKSLSSDSNYYYSQIEDYLVIGNSLEWLKKTIDLIIKR